MNCRPYLGSSIHSPARRRFSPGWMPRRLPTAVTWSCRPGTARRTTLQAFSSLAKTTRSSTPSRVAVGAVRGSRGRVMLGRPVYARGLCQNDARMADKPLVLVIDDETGSRESMAIAIEKAGFEVRTFDDARKALEYLEEAGSARAAVCDLRMPGMDGVAFLKEVRERQLRPRRRPGHRLRLDRVRGRGHARRRRRLPHQAGRPLRAAPAGHEPDREAAAQGGGHQPARDARQALRLREHHRPLGAHGASSSSR